MTTADSLDLASSGSLSKLPADDGVPHLRSKLAAEICQRVDHYFSDDNLRTDIFLLWELWGSKNLPVPVETVRRFSDMRGYHDLSLILEALGNSKVVRLVFLEGKWHVQRVAAVQIEVKEASNNKKVKAAKQKAEWAHRQGFSMFKTKLPKPTGFEANYADAPTTAEAFAEEQDLYGPGQSVFTRLETAIQRYSGRRNFPPALRAIFDRWMAFGGITSGPKQFTGADKSILEDMTARQIADMMATNFITEDALDENKMVIDFEGMARAFLSCVVPVHCDVSNPTERARCINIPRNLFNYLLHHDAIPEHKDAILAARAVCDKAEEEFPKLEAAMQLLPGSFNVACSLLFGGQLAKSLQPHELWTDWANADGAVIGEANMTLDEAKIIFETATNALIGHGESTATAALVGQESMGLEVLCVTPSVTTATGLGKACMHLGRLTCRPWTAPDFAADDLPPNIIGTLSDPAVAAQLASVNEKYTFFVEDHVLEACCFVGMKLEADVHRISWETDSIFHADASSGTASQVDVTGGARHIFFFFDNVKQVLASFYEVVENELSMSGRFTGKWREPRVISREEHVARDAWIQGRGVPGEEESPEEASHVDGSSKRVADNGSDIKAIGDTSCFRSRG